MESIKDKYKIPDGKITYTDLHVPAKPLFSKRYRLAGKPDYIIRQHTHIIPVEVKTKGQYQPRKHHVLQLAAYCQLVEDTYNRFVPYGILVYSNVSQYRIPFDPRLRFELDSVIKRMRGVVQRGSVSRNHNDPQKCRFCSMRMHCAIKLV